MGREQHGPSLPGIPGEDAPEPHPFFRVQSRCRLVCHKDLRTSHKRLGDSRPAPHAAGEPPDFPIGKWQHFHLLQNSINGIFVVDAFQPGHIIYKIKYRQRRVHGKLLRQIADTPAYLLPLLYRVKSAYADGSGRRREYRCQSLHQRGFSRAVMPQQAKHTSVNAEADILQRDRAVLIPL